MSVAALVLGIIGLVFGLITCYPLMVIFSLPCSLLAVIFGIIGRNQCRRQRLPTAMGTAGMVMGVIGLTLIALWVLLYVGLFVFATNQVSAIDWESIFK